MEECLSSIVELIKRKRSTPSAVLQLTGRLMFLTLNCFHNVGRGGLQPFFVWAQDQLQRDYGATLIEFTLTNSPLLSLHFYSKVLTHLEPRIHMLTRVHPKPLIVYSDAEWEVDPGSGWISTGLGGMLWQQGEWQDRQGCAVRSTPMKVLRTLHGRKTQIIPSSCSHQRG